MIAGAGPAYLVGVVACFGVAPVLLRLAILRGTTDGTRVFRATAQTVLILAAVVVAYLLGVTDVDLGPGIVYPILNGACGGIGFLLFSKGIESVEASRAKPATVFGTVVAVALGVAVLGESLTARKLAGIAAAGLAVYLLSS